MLSCMAGIPSSRDRAGTPGSLPRVHNFLETVLLMVVFVTVFTGVLFGLRYESYKPVVGSFSLRYIVVGLAPALVVLAVIGALLLRPTLLKRLPVIGGRVSMPLMVGGAASVLIVALVWASFVPESRLALALAAAVPALGLVFAARALARPHLLLCALPVSVVAAALLVVEAPLLARPPQARWGDDRIFASIHPMEAPFIGAGGRLRPSIDCEQMSAEFPRGAAVVTNRDGFRNSREFGPDSSGETRILSLGDSFSTGYAMPQDRFFGSVLEKNVRERMPLENIAVMNAEVSNPAYGLYYLQEYGLRYRPSIVLYGLSGNDLIQTEHFLGTQARFTMDAYGTMIVNADFDPKRPSPVIRLRDFAYPNAGPPSHRSGLSLVRGAGDRWLKHLGGLTGPAWLGSWVALRPRPAPMYSYAEPFEREDGKKRLIDGLSDLGLYYPSGATVVEDVYRQFFEVLEGLRRATQETGADFVLVMFPQRFQLQPRDWEVVCDRWSLDARDFDLTLPNRRIDAYCSEAGIRCLDLLPLMREKAGEHELYLPGGDMHFNSKGCRVAADITAAFVELLLAEPGALD